MFEGRNFVLWILPLFLAVLLRLITRQYQHQLVFPLCERYTTQYPLFCLLTKKPLLAFFLFH